MATARDPDASPDELAHGDDARSPLPVQDTGERMDESAVRLQTDTRHEVSSTATTPDPSPEQAELPDPFQLDDPDDPISDDEEPTPAVPSGASSQSTIVPPVTEVSLHPPDTLSQAPTPFTPAPEVPGKSQPPLPESEDEDGIPALYLPGLVVPGLFLPIPDTDPLSTLLAKYIPDPNRRPVRDCSGEWQNKDFHTLVMSNSWRALAKMARDRIVNASPNDLDHILGLWHLRLSCLARLRLFNQTSTECTNLFAVLNNVAPPQNRTRLFDTVLPFELELMHARIPYWAGDHLGYLDALARLLRMCKARARTSDAAMWQERGTRVCLTIASQLVEMKDYSAAAVLLTPLCRQGAPALRSAVARIYLQGGHLGEASRHFTAVDADPAADNATKAMNRAIEAAAYGQWDTAIHALKGLLDADPDDALAANNLAVALLSSGKVLEGIETMEKALKTSPLAVTSTEPWLFNLSTLYELRSTTAWDKKRALLIDVAKWSGDGLKTSCLKLPVV